MTLARYGNEYEIKCEEGQMTIKRKRRALNSFVRIKKLKVGEKEKAKGETTIKEDNMPKKQTITKEDNLVKENIEFSDSSDDDEEEEEEEEETQASTRRVSTGRPLSSVDVLDNLRLRNMAGVERLANLRRRIQQQLRKNENKSP